MAVGKSSNFELNTKRNWKPMEMLQERSDMVPFALPEDEAGSAVLYTLEPMYLI